LELPSSSRIQPVFHVSQLKQYVPPTHQVHSELRSTDALADSCCNSGRARCFPWTHFSCSRVDSLEQFFS
jgi:hypothetical protein